MLYFKGRLEMILSILNILLIIGNSYMVFIHTPQLVEEEFTKKWGLSRFVYDFILEKKEVTRKQIYKAVIEKRPKATAEDIESEIAYTLSYMTDSRMVERNSRGVYTLAPSASELIEKSLSPYKKLVDMQQRDYFIQRRVEEISFSHCYEFDIQQMYNKIKSEDNIDVGFDYFKMIVYSKIRTPHYYPYVYDGYILNSDGKICHLAAKR